MIPISEYATVTLGTSLTDAILALEKAQNAYTSSKYQHRAILVLDHNGNVVGKVGQLCALQAIEPRYDFNDKIEKVKKYNFSEEYLIRLRERYRFEETVLETGHLQAIAEKKVEEFMQKPRLGEFVAENCNIDTAIHKLVSGRHQSLLVTRQERIIGILRMADVFAAVSHEIHKLAD